MHDPGEMLRKISELEKGLPNSNRPEIIYARSHLLLAETGAKLLYVFIDIAQKLEKLNKYLMAQEVTNVRSDVDVSAILDKDPARIRTTDNPEDEKPARYWDPEKWCTKCDQMVRRSAVTHRLFCQCGEIGEIAPNNRFLATWVDMDEPAEKDPITQAEEEIEDARHEAEFNPAVDAIDAIAEAEGTPTGKEDSGQQPSTSDIDEDSGLGEFKDDTP